MENTHGEGSSSADFQVVDELCTFLEVAIHLLLHQRQVYPREAFERRRHLDVSVYRSRHPELNEYIAITVQGARKLLERNEADAFIVVIRDKDRHVLERFHFDMHYETLAIDLELLREQLRGILVKVHTCDTLLTDLPPDATFDVELHTAPTRARHPLPDS